jgi:hypothetical protein
MFRGDVTGNGRQPKAEETLEDISTGSSTRDEPGQVVEAGVVHRGRPS